MDYSSPLAQQLVKSGHLTGPQGNGGGDPNAPTGTVTNVSNAPDEECLICMDDFKPSSVSFKTCCSNPVCADCYIEGLATNAKCSAMDCGCLVDPRGIRHEIEDLKDEKAYKTALMEYSKEKLGGWESCNTGSCNGGRPTDEAGGNCITCGQPILAASQSGAVIPVKMKNGSMMDMTLSPQELIAFSGSVACPKCGTGVQRDGGCSLLQCKCNHQFQCDGSPGKQHSEAGAEFDKALSTLSERSTEKELMEVLGSNRKWAELFHLPELVQLVKAAGLEGEKGVVQMYLNLLDINRELFRGLIDCLSSLYMPKSDAAAKFLELVSQAQNFEALLKALTAEDCAGAYAEMAQDTVVIQWFVDNPKAEEMFWRRKANTIKNVDLKKRVVQLKS